MEDHESRILFHEAIHFLAVTVCLVLSVNSAVVPLTFELCDERTLETVDAIIPSVERALCGKLKLHAQDTVVSLS